MLYPLGLAEANRYSEADYVYNSLLTGRPYFLQMIEDIEIATRFVRYQVSPTPTAHSDFAPTDVPAFVNDQIARTLAGVPTSGRPLFLKIPFFGPGPLEELVAYDPSLIVGILVVAAEPLSTPFSYWQKHGSTALGSHCLDEE